MCDAIPAQTAALRNGFVFTALQAEEENERNSELSMTVRRRSCVSQRCTQSDPATYVKLTV